MNNNLSNHIPEVFFTFQNTNILQRLVVYTFVFTFLKKVLNPNFTSIIFPLNVLIMYKRELFQFCSFLRSYFTTYNCHFTSMINTTFEENIFIKIGEVSTECVQLVGILWWQTLSNDSEVIKFCRSRQLILSLQWEPGLRHSGVLLPFNSTYH